MINITSDIKIIKEIENHLMDEINRVKCYLGKEHTIKLLKTAVMILEFKN